MLVETKEKNAIVKDHIFLKARMISEGVRLQVSEEESPELYKLQMKNREDVLSKVEIPKKLDFTEPEGLIRLFAKLNVVDPGTVFRQYITLDDSNLVAPIYPDERSRLDLKAEGNDIIVSEGGKILVTGKFPEQFKWLEKKLSNGIPITAVLPAMSKSVINLVFSLSCMNYNTNRGCRYCNLFANPLSRKISMLPEEVLRVWVDCQVEAVQIALKNGWQGNIAISGGALAPAQRGEYLDRMEIVMTSLKKALGDEIFNSIPKIYNYYAPEDFSDMLKWREMGISATCIDLEVMDPAYFAAICPGKHAYKPLEYWKKAQEYSVEVFGPLFGTFGCIVMGMEPMSTLIKGFDERMSKGIMSLPITFHCAPGSALEGFRPPRAEWIVEAGEKMADSFMKYLLMWIKPAMEKAKEKGKSLYEFDSGSTPASHQNVLFDELSIRINKLLDGRSISDFLK